MLKQVAGGCINETGATDEDVAAMANKQLPTTHTGKCFNFCVMHLFNCVSKRRVEFFSKTTFFIFRPPT